MNHEHKRARGQALVLIAFGLVGLIGLTALAVDGGNAYSDKRHAQNAADTAVLAAALAKVRQPADVLPVDAWKQAGYDRSTSNGYDNNGATNTVHVYQCDEAEASCGSAYQGNPEYVQVIITSQVRTYFAPVVGIKKIDVKVNAVAHGAPPTTDKMFDGNALVSLSPHDCKALDYNGNGTVTVTGGGVFVNSDCLDAALFSNSSTARLYAPDLCTVGGYRSADGSLVVSPGPIKTGCPPLGYPPKTITEPNPTCYGDAVKDGNTLWPGNYSGPFPPAGVTNLQSGIYCVSGDFALHGGDTLTGIGVVIRMNSGDVTWNATAHADLEAPTSGPFKGLLLYMPSTNAGTITINGDSSSIIKGTILAPAADITIAGSGDTCIQGQIIGYTVKLTGDSSTCINYDANLNYHALTPPELESIH